MPVELRKRKAPAEPVPAPAAKKASSRSSSKTSTSKTSASTTKAKAPASKSAAPATANGAPKVGDTIKLDGFGGAIQTNDGESTTLKKLLDDSANGVVLLAYPKASTPGCTTQVCLARDSFDELTSTGFSIFGLSRDSPKANTTFKTKQNLPYSLICDTAGTLISAVGLKKAPSGTTRGVFVVDKNGKVLAAQPGGPAATIEVVKQLVGAPTGDADEKSDKKAAGKAEKKVEEEGKGPKEV